MRIRHAVMAALLLCAAAWTTRAQSFYPVLSSYSDDQKQTIDKIFAYDLSTEYDGLTESALAIVTQVKLDTPADEYSNIREKIEELAKEGATQVIRYKAYLASVVFATPLMFGSEAVRAYESEDAMFSAIAERISKTLLSSNQ